MSWSPRATDVAQSPRRRRRVAPGGRAGALALGALMVAALAPPVAIAEPGTTVGPTGPTPNPATTSYGAVPDEFGLTISPTRLVIGPEDAGTTHEVLAVNRGQTTASVTVQKRNFTGAADGSLAFDPTAPYAASDWVTVSPMSFELAPGTSRIVTAQVARPSDAEPGDHQLALVFLVPAGQTGGNIKINRGIGIPFYIAVPGPIDDSASIEDFRAPGFVTGGPVTLSATVANTGTVHRDFRSGEALTVTGAGKPLTFPDFTVSRGATRIIETTWDPPLLCICHPEMSFVNDDGHLQSAKVRVIVFPLGLALGLLGGVLILALIVILIRHRRRSTGSHAVSATSRATSGEEA